MYAWYHCIMFCLTTLRFAWQPNWFNYEGITLEAVRPIFDPNILLYFYTSGRIRLFAHCTLPRYHHYADAKSIKCLSGTFCRVCVSKSILSIILQAIYGVVCIELTHHSYNDCKKARKLSYYHHQIGCITYLPLLRIKSWDNGMRCMLFYILIRVKAAQLSYIY